MGVTYPTVAKRNALPAPFASRVTKISMSKQAWFFLVGIRALLGIGLATGLWVIVWNQPWPVWLRILVDIIIGDIVIIGFFALGPVTYKDYLRYRQRVQKAQDEIEQRP